MKPLFEKCEICGKYKDIDRMIMVANRGRTVRHYCYDCYQVTKFRKNSTYGEMSTNTLNKGE